MRLSLEHCRHLRERPARTRRAIALATHAFAAVDGPARLGWSSHRDYARSRLGLSWGRYQAYRRCGALLASSPAWNAAVAQGDVGWSVLEVAAGFARGLDFDAWLPALRGHTVPEARAVLESSVREPPAPPLRESTPLREPPPSSEFVRLRFVLPAPVAHYADETLEVAKALLGQEVPDDQALAAIVAEASTEIAPTAEPHHARRILDQHRLTANDTRTKPTPIPPTTQPAHRDPHRRAAVLDRALRRWLDQLREHDANLDAFFLDVAENQLHTQAGFHRIVDFAAAHLDLAERTTFERLHRARLRRRHDPVACALAAGRIGPSQSELLVRLRRAGIPRTSLAPWVEFARAHTVRALREAVRWARTQLSVHARAYVLDGALPPTLDQLRTSIRPLEDIVASPEPPELDTLQHTHFVPRTWTLERDTAELLALLLGSTPPNAPAVRWWSVLRVLALARGAWAQHARRSPHPHRAVLSRDRWTCAVPECTCRSGLEVHHIRFRSAGGGDQAENLVTLCAYHHRRALHGSPSTLRIHGSAHQGRDSLRFQVGPIQYPSAVLHFEGERRMHTPTSTSSREAPRWSQAGELPGLAISFA